MKVWYLFTILNIKEWKKKQRPTYTQYVHSMAIKYKITTNNMSWDVKILSYSFLFIFFPWALQKNIFLHGLCWSQTWVIKTITIKKNYNVHF